MILYSNDESGIALYKQVENSIREKIEQGQWSLGSRLPTEEELSRYFNVSRTTVRKAVDGMIEAGLLKRKQGSGTYVVKATYSRSSFNAQPSDTVCKYIYTPFIKQDLKYSYTNILRTFAAHILMLKRQKLIKASDAKKILRFLLSLRDKHSDIIGTNPLNEDCFLNLEQLLTSNLGMELTSKALIGRSRNDMTPTMIRMSIRDGLITVLKKLEKLISIFLDKAESNRGYIMTGYTHQRPGQPITLEYWFLAGAEALERDMERLLDAFKRLNLSPLGACALAGTSYNIDRRYTAKLLGFDGIITNALDAVSSRDFIPEIGACFSGLGSTIGRLNQDLLLWSMDEVSYVRFSDSTSCCSTIMPQKKNPLSAEHIRSRTAHLSALYIDIVMVLKGTGFSHSRDLFECMPPFYSQMEQMISILDLATDMIPGIRFNYSKMETDATLNNSILTDISEAIEKRENIPLRIIHNILALAVEECRKRKKAEPELEDILRISRKVCDRELNITESEFEKFKDVKNSVMLKKSEGSPSPWACEKMEKSLRETLSSYSFRLKTVNDQQKRSLDLMNAEAEAVMRE